MAKIRVHELAKKLNITSKALIAKLTELGVKVKSHTSSVDEKIAKKLTTVSAKKKKAAPSAPKVKDKTAAPRPSIGKPKKAKKAAPAKVVKKAKVSVEKGEKSSRAAVVKKAAKPALKKETPEKKEKEEVVKKPPEITITTTLEEEAPVLESPLKPLVEEPLRPMSEEEENAKVPDRFKKEADKERLAKFKVKPGMQRAFSTIKKVDTAKKWHSFKSSHKRHDKRSAAQKSDTAVEPAPTQPRKRVLKFQEGTTVKEFAELIGQKLTEVIKKFMELGYMPTINQPLDADAAQIAAESFGLKIESIPIETEEDLIEEAEVDAALLSPRPPIVTIMGHVDHGKTTLLDVIRETKVTESEAGGITQHIGAYKVTLNNKDIVFLDTPGHEAFTMMRARGAKVTDIVVLVVAADDSVMPQTIEAIDHAKAANVPIVVAINKIDKPDANIERTRTELSNHGVVSEDWGGKNILVEVSAKNKTGIEHLLEMILLQAEMMELKANYDRHAKGTIIEAKLDKGKGPVATVLIQTGTLKAGDTFLSGTLSGKVRALIDDNGKRIEKAVPSTPVEVIGFPDVPQAGDIFIIMDDEKKARQIAMNRIHKQRSAEAAKKAPLTLDSLYEKIKEGKIKDLNVIIKADVHGSVEAVRDALESISHPEVKVKVIHTGAGGINESDVMLAAASNAIIIGFNIRADAKASLLAEQESVDIKFYNVIYEVIDSVKQALEGMLAPTVTEKILGKAEVRQIFTASKLGTIAGCHVIDGTIVKASSGMRILRDNIVVYDGKISSLKRFKDDAKEVQSGYECGITIENFNDIKVGDILENYQMEEVATKLELNTDDR